jgi:hypothetical protein
LLHLQDGPVLSHATLYYAGLVTQQVQRMLSDSQTCSLPPGLSRLVSVWRAYEAAVKAGHLPLLQGTPGGRLLTDTTAALIAYLTELVKVRACMRGRAAFGVLYGVPF